MSLISCMLHDTRTVCVFFFFFHDTATTEIYTLSYTTLFRSPGTALFCLTHKARAAQVSSDNRRFGRGDRKSTRLNSSHVAISYAVFCLKKKKNNKLSPYLHKEKKKLQEKQ